MTLKYVSVYCSKTDIICSRISKENKDINKVIKREDKNKTILNIKSQQSYLKNYRIINLIEFSKINKCENISLINIIFFFSFYGQRWEKP